MAKDILITPKPSIGYPKIVYSGADVSAIKKEVLDNGDIVYTGASGQLLAFFDSLSGAVMSVNDISGIQLIKVTDTGDLKIKGSLSMSQIGTVPVTEMFFPASFYNLAVTGETHPNYGDQGHFESLLDTSLNLSYLRWYGEAVTPTYYAQAGYTRFSWKVPADFDSWQTTAMSLYVRTDLANFANNNEIFFSFYNGTNWIGQTVAASTTADVWIEYTPNTFWFSTLVPGEVLNITAVFLADDGTYSEYVDWRSISLNYNKKIIL